MPPLDPYSRRRFVRDTAILTVAPVLSTVSAESDVNPSWALFADTHIAFQSKHSALIKFATAGLFLALFVLLLHQIFR